MKRLACLTLIALVALALTARAQAPTPLAAAVGGNMNHVPSFVGVEKGIFLKHGIDLKLKVLATGQEMSKALQAGEVQIIGSAFSNYPVAVERGMAAKGVVGLMGDRTGRYSDEPISVWTRKGSGVTKLEDLAGKRVGLAIGGTGDEYLTALLKKKGVARDKVHVPQRAARQHACRRCRAAAWTPWRCGSRSARSSRPRCRTPCWSARGGGHISYYINMAIVTELIDKSPDVVERYVIGVAEAAQYTRKNLDEAAEIATRWAPGLEAAVARKALRHMTFDPRITPHTVAAWEENVRLLVEQKKLRAALPWQQGIELRFIEKVTKSHPQLFADLKPAP